MEFFKKKSLLLIAAMFAACALVIGCGSKGGDPDDPNTPPPPPPPPGAEVVFDNFEWRDDPSGVTDGGFTTQNMLPNGGSWYAYGCTGDKVETHEGQDLLDDMLPAIAEELSFVIDVENGTDYQCATVTCQFFDNGNEGDNTKHKSANLSDLKSIKIKGGLQGVMFISFFSSKVNSSQAGAWGWSVDRGWDGEMKPFGSNMDSYLELNVSDMTNNDWNSGKLPTKEDFLSAITSFKMSVDTEEDVKVIASISEIVLVFKDESSVPADLK